MVAAFGVQFSPFVFETHGGLGDKALEFVDKLSLHAAARPGASSRGNFRFHLLSSLSVIIQRANAQLVAHHYVQSYDASRYQPGRVLQVGGAVKLIHILCYFFEDLRQPSYAWLPDIKRRVWRILGLTGWWWALRRRRGSNRPLRSARSGKYLAMFGCWLAVQLRSSGERQCPFSRTVCTANTDR